MAIIVGQGEFQYRIIEDWAKLPDGWSFKEVAAVGVDKNDNVYAFGRGEHPMMVFDRNGNFLRSWGEGQYPRAHGVHMGPDEFDLPDRRWRPFRPQMPDRGRQGAAGAGRPRHAGALSQRRAVQPLHPYRPVAERRDLRLGRLRQRPRPQIFARRQAFDLVGRARQRSRPVQPRPQHLQPTPTAGSMSPTARTTASRCSTATASTRRSGTICTARAASTCPTRISRSATSARLSVNRLNANLGPRVSIVDNQGKLLSRIGDPFAGTAPTSFIGPHGLAVDFARRPLCRRGVLDPVAGPLPRPAAPAGSARPAEIRTHALRRMAWRPSSGAATTGIGSSRTGRNCPTAGRSRRSARSGSTRTTTSMSSIAASTR